MLGEKVAFEAVSPHLYVFSLMVSVSHLSGSCTPTSDISNLLCYEDYDS